MNTQLINALTQVVIALTKWRDTLLINKANPRMDHTSMIIKWANAVAKEEGARPSLNNPGNLKYSNLTSSWGGKRGYQASDGGWICSFPTYQVGFDALCNFLTLGAEDQLIAYHSPEARTLEGFSKIYGGNPPQGYIDAIAKLLEVPVDTLISTFLILG